MAHFAGLDVSLAETAICIVDEVGEILCEGVCPTEPSALIEWFSKLDYDCQRIGFESGACSAWLYRELKDAGLPVFCIEARHASRVLQVQAIKTDRNDARGLAQMMRTGWFKVVHVKDEHAQKLRALLHSRRCLLDKRLDLENHIRGTLRSFGLKLGRVTLTDFEARVRELIGEDAELALCLGPLLEARWRMHEQYRLLQTAVMRIVRNDEICRRLMTAPGVGPLTALTYKTAIDDPRRFAKSRSIGAHFGLTPRKYASGEVDFNGRITRSGDTMVRDHLFEAAHSLLTRSKRHCALKTWGLRIAKRSSLRKATVAVARKLSIILHRMWVDGTDFWLSGEPATPADAAT